VPGIVSRGGVSLGDDATVVCENPENDIPINNMTANILILNIS
jgi:hypothetical protein